VPAPASDRQDGVPKLRILHVLTEPRGGGGRYAKTLARAAQARGSDVMFAAPVAIGDGFETVALAAVARAARNADLVHCHGVRSGLFQTLTWRKPTIVTPNGLHALERTSGLRRRVARVVTRFSLGRADAVICVSADEFRVVQGLGPTIARRARLIRNGSAPVELPGEEERRVVRGELGLDAHDPALLFVGALRHQKNPQLAIEAVVRARAHLPRLVLLIAGDGPLAPELRAADRSFIHLLGQRDDVGRLLAACDAVINTSRWEGLSFALVEALWRGRPLIVTDVPGNADAAGDAGLTVPSDIDSVTKAILTLFTTPDLLRRLGGKARRRAEQSFDERTMIEATLVLYDEICGRSSV
jgi:glycosyltransferase involved in cell wall biosynthesis